MKEKFIQFIEEKFLPVAGKIAGNRYLNAIKDGFVFTMPFLIVGSFILLLVNLPFTDKSTFMYMEWYDKLMQAYKANLVQPYYVSMGIMALFVAYGMGYSLSSYYKLSNVTGGFLSLYGFLVVAAKSDWMPLSADGAKVFLLEEGNWMPVMDVRFLDAKGIFSAIIFGLLAVEIYRFLVSKKLTIKLPDSVPPAIAKSFELLIPVAVVAVVYQAISLLVQKISGSFVPALIMQVVVEPLLKMSDTLPSIVIIVLLVHILWFVGLHGTNILLPVINTIALSNLAINQAALQAGNVPTKVFAGGFLDSYVFMGGVGTTLGLAIAMARSKNEHLKSIGKLSVVPAIFNINEPIMFGAPVVMNPMLIVPFVLVPVINTIVAYVLTKMGLLGYIVTLVPWTTPGPIAALLATNFNIFSMIVSLVLIFTSYAMYIPFIRAYEVSLEKTENVQK